MGDVATAQPVNGFFHQDGEHRNIFDFDLLACAFEQAGFRGVERADEGALLGGFPDFPRRGDDDHGLYASAAWPGGD